MRDEDEVKMLMDTMIEIGLRGNIRIPYYREKGYTIPTKMTKNKGERIDYSQKLYVGIEDMPEYSEAKVTIKCDYQEDGCRDVYLKSVGDYIRNNKNSAVKKDCCSNKKCVSKKTAECNMVNYGFEYHVNQPEQIKRTSETNIQKYGSKNIMGSEHFKEKSKETVFERYGVENISQLDHVKIKKAATFFKNGTIATSKQQRYLHGLFGGELNYSNNTPCLDIAFPEEKLYIEFDGSGHDLNLKMGQITEKEFLDKEKKKYYYLERQGWKAITIISKIDRIPEDKILIEMLRFAREYIGQDHSWIRFDIDNGKIISSLDIQPYAYGKLKSYIKFRKEYDSQNQGVLGHFLNGRRCLNG